jgi:hypothetical protein
MVDSSNTNVRVSTKPGQLQSSVRGAALGISRPRGGEEP